MSELSDLPSSSTSDISASTTEQQSSIFSPPSSSSTEQVPPPASSSSTVETPISTSATSLSSSITEPASSSSDTPYSTPTSALPVGSISSSKGTNAGAIAGAVIGVLGVLGLILGAFLLYRRRRRGRPLLSTRAASGGSGGSSTERKGPQTPTRPSHPQHNTSVGTLDGTAEDTLDGHTSYNKMGGGTWGRYDSAEKAAQFTSPPVSTDEHGLSGSVGSAGAETLAGSADFAPTHAYYSRSRHGSAQSSVTTVGEHFPEAPRRSSSRRRSQRDSGNDWAQPHLVAAPRNALPPSAGERDRALSSPSTTYPPPRRHASATSVGSVQLERGRASSFENSTTSLVGTGAGSTPQLVAAPAPAGVTRAPSAARRPKKKPVPRYSVDPNAPSQGELPPSSPATPIGFDGRPVHYLIPDMPVEQH